MHTMHLLSGVAIQPNLELKTQPKQLLGSLPLVITLPGLLLKRFCSQIQNKNFITTMKFEELQNPLEFNLAGLELCF